MNVDVKPTGPAVIPEAKLQKAARAFLKRHSLERKGLFREWQDDPIGHVWFAIASVPDAQSVILARYWRRCQRRALEWGGANYRGKAT